MELEEEMSYQIPVPKKQQPINLDLVPSSLLVAKAINGKPHCDCSRYFFDSGGTKTCSIDDVPCGSNAISIRHSRTGTTAAGSLPTTEFGWKIAYFQNFSRSKKTECTYCIRCTSKCKYDVILGRDYLHQLGIDTHFSTKK
jgi:hypothetical protein